MGNQGVSAAAAASRMQALGLLRPGLPPVAGDVVYFGPSADNEFDGHVGIYLGAGRFRSITTFGLADAPMAGWQAPYLGFVDPTTVGTNRFGGAVSPRLGV
jgi:cell wall-associated NlpC family hydrolase